MKNIFFLILLFFVGSAAFGQSWNTITGKNSFTDSVRLLKYRHPANLDSALSVDPTTGNLIFVLRSGSSSFDSTTIIDGVFCVYKNGLPTCYDLGRFFDSVSLNHDSTYYKFWNAGNFIDSIWVPQDNVYAVPPLFVNRYQAFNNLGDSVVFSIDTTGFNTGGTVIDTAFLWSVRDSLSVPPSAPDTGAIYLVGTSPTGAFVSHNNQIATWNGTIWTFQTAGVGNLLYNAETGFVSKFNGGVWTRLGRAVLHQFGDVYASPIVWGSRDYNPIIAVSNDVRSGSIGDSTTQNTSWGFGALRYGVLQKLSSNSVGESNTAIGYKALQNNTTGSTNNAIGRNALGSNTTGSNNTANGDFSLNSNTTGFQNIAIGGTSMQGNVVGTDNTAVGYGALSAVNTGQGNVAIGEYALRANTSGQLQVAIGTDALTSNTIGSLNTAVGRQSQTSNTTGSENTSIGLNSLRANTTGLHNTSNGTSAMFSNTTGSDNVAAGYQAGSNILGAILPATILNNSIMIGSKTRPLADDETGEIVIGTDITGLGSNTTLIGDSNTVSTFIQGSLNLGTKTPEASNILNVESTTRGVRFSTMNTTEMNAIASPANGTMVYNTDSACYCSYNGAIWVKMCGGSGGGSSSSLQGVIDNSNYLTREDTVVTGSNLMIQNIPNVNFNKFSVVDFWENAITTPIDSNYGWHDRGTFGVQPLTVLMSSSGDTAESVIGIRTDPGSGNKYVLLDTRKLLEGNNHTQFLQDQNSFNFISLVSTGLSTEDTINSKIYMKVDTSGGSPTLLYGIGTDGSVQLFSGGGGGTGTLQQSFNASITAASDPIIDMGGNVFNIYNGANEFLTLDPTTNSEISNLTAKNNTGFGNRAQASQYTSDVEAISQIEALFSDGFTLAQIGLDANSTEATINYLADKHTFTGLFILNTVGEYADNAAAISAGLAVGTVYRTSDNLKIVH